MTERTLSAAEVDAVASQLAHAAMASTPVDALIHEPMGVDDGYRIQHAGCRMASTEPVAWKAGCTSAAAQQMLGVDTPVFGRYRSDQIDRSPIVLRLDEFVTPPHIEVEIGLRLTADLDEIPDDPLDLAEIVEAFAAIEVVAGRLTAFPFVGAAQLVADNVVAGRMVVGPALGLTVDGLRRLDEVAVELDVDGESVAAAHGSAALGHPLRVLDHVARHARSAGRGLRSGELVITGTCTGLVAARRHTEHIGRVGGTETRVRFE